MIDDLLKAKKKLEDIERNIKELKTIGEWVDVAMLTLDKLELLYTYPQLDNQEV